MGASAFVARWAPRLKQTWRQVIRMTAAALVAYLATQFGSFHEGHWAVITCLVVVQGSFATTLDASLSRVLGTVAGAVIGALGVFLIVRGLLPAAAALALAVVPTAALAAADGRFRLAPVTAGLLVLAAAAGDHGVGIAVDRVGEILLGAVIGVACTLLIFPERAEHALRRHAAAVLDTLGTIVRLHLLGEDVEALHRDLEMAFGRVQAICAEVRREQIVRLGRGPAPEPFVHALRRLRTDVALIERARIESGGIDRTAAAETLRQWFADAATALRDADVLPDAPQIVRENASDAARDFAALPFALATLRREQLNFVAHAAARTAVERG